MSSEIKTLLKYANLQMAAEATRLDRVIDGTMLLQDALVLGNNRASRFPTTLAKSFAEEGWSVVAHQSSTSTGFSGTLFKNRSGELVLSFRSTEFADDAVRDTQATNDLEIRKEGWAFGQIDDMQQWYESLVNRGLITGSFAVTGYSLGGHLATAFNLLYPGAARRTFTFNGAGVGQTSGLALQEVIDAFHDARINGSASRFTTANARALYEEFRSQIAGQATREYLAAAVSRVAAAKEDPTTGTVAKEELDLLLSGLERVIAVTSEIERVSGITNGGLGGNPVRVPAAEIEATHLDYQLAVSAAGVWTDAYRVSSTELAEDVKNNARKVEAGPGNIYDVYGAAGPSAVSNSQIHYGISTPVWIEDQPLYRGDGTEALKATALYLGLKLLANNFSENDFGDTHSLVLLVDSLSVQSALAGLDDRIPQYTLNRLLGAASAERASSTSFTQGRAEGDVLENVVNQLARLVGIQAQPLVGNNTGGTWADPAAREQFHQRLKEVTSSPVYAQLAGRVRLEQVHPASADAARGDFAVLTSLLAGTTFSLRSVEGQNSGVAAILGVVHQPAYADWRDDLQRITAGAPRDMLAFTDTFLHDRAAMLNWQIVSHLQNTEGIASGSQAPFDRALEYRWTDETGGRALFVSNTQAAFLPAQVIAFGGEGADSLSGNARSFGDHLYGGGGNDELFGLAGNDYLEGDAGDDVLDGGLDSDVLLGGMGKDRYKFSGAWGRDTVIDADGNGSISIDDETLMGGRAAGGNTWLSKTTSGTVVAYTVVDSTGSATAKELVITSNGNSGNKITVKHFDLARAMTSEGYLGIKLDPTPKLAVIQGVGSNFWTDLNADLDSLRGKSSDLDVGRTFTVYLNQAVAAGRSILLKVEGTLKSLVKAVVGDAVVDANGATIELQPGQTQVSFALIGEAAGSGSFSVVLTGEGETVTSNTWGLSVAPAASQPNVLNGDYTKLVTSGQYAIDSTGNYVADPANPVSLGAADVLTGSAQADRILGLSGNDLLFGKDGNDRLEGGAGVDILHGGLGADTLEGGEGDDLIYGSSTGDFAYLTNADWSFSSLPYPLTTLTTGFGWRTYTDGSRDADGFLQVALGSDVQRDKQDGDQSNTIDAGAGDDTVAAGTGDDRVKGGDGADDIYGMSGSDVLLGEAGDDRIYGDGPAPQLGLQLVATAAADQHRSDFIDGGEGNDILIGQGGSDVVYGGVGNDRIWGDDRSLVNTPASVHGDDYLDGEDGQDTIVGGGKNDTIYGGADNDVLKGDDDADRLGGENHGDDYIDGEGGNDTIYGGGRSDRLSGGAGDDRLLGDDKALGAAFDGDDSLDGKEGKDTLVGGGASDRLYGGDDADKLYGDGEIRETPDLELARHGDDYLDGGKGDDLLIGGGGSDTLMGGAGADDIEGDGNGASAQYERSDWIDGGEGDDQLRGGGGADTVRGSEGADKLWGDTGDDGLDGGAGNDLLFGGEGNDRLEGGTEDDQLFGGQGSDRLSGGAGNDLLDGGAGNDILAGGAGDDKLKAGEGSDTLEGGEGNDTYLVAAGPGVTTIDADSGTDLVTFEAPLALGTLSGSSADDEILLNLSTEQQVLVRGNANFLIGGQVINSAVLASILNARGRPGPGAPSPAPQTTTTNLYDGDGRVVGSLVRQVEAAGSTTTTTYLGADGTGPKLSSQWTSSDGGYGSETYDLRGFVTGTRHPLDGSYTEYEITAGGSYEVTYSAQGVVLRDAWTSTEGAFSGWHGNTIYNADGTYRATDYALDGSYRTSATYGNGMVREQSYDATGAPVDGGRLHLSNGTYTESEDDGHGTITTTFFSTSGVRQGQQVRLPDGSHGITTYKANGASSSTLYRRDGTYSKTEVDGEGQTVTKNYAIGGRLLGSTVTEVNGMSSITTVLNAAAQRVSQSWTEPDGTSGTSSVGARDYYGALNRITASRSAHPEVWGRYYIPDGAWYSFDSSSSQSWWGDSWGVYDTGGNRMGADGYFLAEYLNDPTYTRSRYEASFDVGSSTKFVFDVGYEAPEHARVRTWGPVAYPIVFNYELLDLETGVQVYGTASATHKYIESYDYTRRIWGGFTELGAINSQVKIRFEGGYGNGKYAVLYEDGFGNVSLTGYSSSGVRLSEMWLHSDGSYGVDRYLPDGSAIGTTASADSALHTYRTASGSSPEVATYPRVQGIIAQAVEHAPTLTTDVLVAAPAPQQLGVAPASTYRFEPITIRLGDTRRAVYDGAGNVLLVDYDNTSFQVRTDPGYDSAVVVNGTRYDWSYDVYGMPTSRTASSADGTFETCTVDNTGRVNGRTVSTTSADGSIATLRYSSTGQFIGTSAETHPDTGQKLTKFYDAAGALSGSTLEVTDGYGNTILSEYDGNGVLARVTTRVVTAVNETTITVYDGAGTATSIEVTSVSAAGVIQTDMYAGGGDRVSTVVAALESDGSVMTSNYDAAGKLSSFVLSRITPERDTIITTYDAQGHKKREDMLHASGVHEYATFRFDGSTQRTIVQLDGSYQIAVRDATGELTSTQYSAQGAKLSDTWSRLDGSTGSDTYNADGSSTSITNYSDGSRSTSTADVSGTTTTRHFTASGAFLGTTIARDVQGGFESTSFNASGVKTNAVALHADGSRAEYVYQATGAYTGTISRVDGSRDELSGTAQGVVTIAHYGATGALLSTSVNRAPVAGTATVAASAHVGQSFSLALPQALFTDADAGDSLSYRASLVGSAYLPEWLSFDAASRTFTGVPPAGAIGNVALQVTATDRDGASATKQVTVQVAGLRAVKLAPQTATEEETWTFTVPASTFIAQGQTGALTYAASLAGGAALPAWLQFDAATRTFSGTPLNRDVGALSLSVTATDSYGSAIESTFSLAIANTNDAPVAWVPVDEQVAAMGRAWAFVVPDTAFRDMDAGDALTFTASVADGSPLPSWLAFDATTRRFTGTPPVGEPAALQVVVVATDLAGASTTTGFELALVPGNRAPIVADPLDDLQVQEGSEDWTFTVPAGAFVDDDPGDTLTYSARMVDGSAVPAWLAFDPATRSFSGTPERQDIGTIDLVVTAADAAGETASDTFTLAVARAPNLTVVGTPDADALAGGAGDDSIDGLAAADTMSGGRGDDRYVVDDAADVVLENPGQGADTVYASVAYSLGANVENLVLTGMDAIDGFGNDLANTLQGNAAGNTLDGGAGADSLHGGAGDDRYVVDNAGDAVVENAGEGVDTVHSEVDYALGASLEHLVLTGTSAIDGTGNGLANRIQGNAADNTLDGASGSDTLLGGAGNDAYVVDGADDVVTENAEEGVDTVYAGIAYTLGANLENLVLTGTAAIDGFGNELANRLNGNDGNNVLDGRAGADTMAGGAGNDTYMADNTGDVVVEDAGAGTDIVYSLATLALGANVENLVLAGTAAIDGFGNDLANTLQGNTAANTLDGGAGADRLLGGFGNDRYVVDNLGDVVVENAGEGEDTVNAAVDYVLGANLEHLVLTGTSAIDGAGNELANRIQGNAADNTLDGGAGSDILLGGAGNDGYIVDDRRDILLENAGEGADTVYSALGYELGANLENLVLTGTAAIDGLGNALDNQISGNAGENVLIGGSGNDRLDGAGGGDVLIGGVGDDIYVLNRGSGAEAVVERGGSAGDLAQFGSGIAADQLWFSRSGSSLVVQVIGTSDSLTVKNWYATLGREPGRLMQVLFSFHALNTGELGNWFTRDDRIDWFKTSDGKVLQEAQVQNLVEAMAAFAPPPAGQTTLSPEVQAALLPTIAANWQ